MLLDRESVWASWRLRHISQVLGNLGCTHDLSAHLSQCTSRGTSVQVHISVHIGLSALLSPCTSGSVHVCLIDISLCTSGSSPSLCAHLARRHLSVHIWLVAISLCASVSSPSLNAHLAVAISWCTSVSLCLCLPPVSVLVSSLSMPLSRRLCSPPGTYVDLYTVELLASVTPQVPLRSDPTTSLMLASPSLFLAVR